MMEKFPEKQMERFHCISNVSWPSSNRAFNLKGIRTSYELKIIQDYTLPPLVVGGGSLHFFSKYFNLLTSPQFAKIK